MSIDVNEEDIVSNRGRAIIVKNSDVGGLWDLYLEEAKNNYDPVKNPEGVINLTASLNTLVEKEWQERLRRPDVLKFTSSLHQHYYNLSGSERLRQAAAGFFNRHHNPVEPIQSQQISVMPGGIACLEVLSFCLFDEGDSILIPTPTYIRTPISLVERFKARAVLWHLKDEPDADGRTFSISAKALEAKILELGEAGTNLKGFAMINPNNPLGEVYDATTLREILKVCAKYKLQVIMDEVYAFSHFDLGNDFISVLSMNGILPDPERTHCVWSFSKDLGLAGFRCGFIHTKNEAVHKILTSFGWYQTVPIILQDACATVLNDVEWMDNFFIPLNKKRARQRYYYAFKKLSEIGVDVRPSSAGFAIWADLRPFLREKTEEAEFELLEEMKKKNFAITPGSFYYCGSPGWFRIAAAVTKEKLDEGLTRLDGILQNRRAQLEHS